VQQPLPSSVDSFRSVDSYEDSNVTPKRHPALACLLRPCSCAHMSGWDSLLSIYESVPDAGTGEIILVRRKTGTVATSESGQQSEPLISRSESAAPSPFAAMDETEDDDEDGETTSEGRGRIITGASGRRYWPAAAAPVVSAPAASTAASPFSSGGAPANTAAVPLFRSMPVRSMPVPAVPASLFGGGGAPADAPLASPFGGAPVPAAVASLFGSGGVPKPAFGAVTPTASATPSFRFGAAAPDASPLDYAGGLFGAAPAASPFGAPAPAGGLFGATPTAGGLFGAAPAAGGLLGAPPAVLPFRFGAAAARPPSEAQRRPSLRLPAAAASAPQVRTTTSRTRQISMERKEVLYLDEAVGAWNIDGSSDALAESGSWLRDAEEATGRRRGRCSFEGCPNQAEVGGHVWIKGVGCFIAPICKPCNRYGNQDRMQGAKARLRKNIEVTRTGMTEGMRTATRRVAGGGGGRRRRCESCDNDISDRPASHTLCLGCWSGSGRRGGGRSGRAAGRSGRGGGRRGGGRVCDACGVSIAGAPTTHYLCRKCF
jgi:hypothetical protein